MMSAAEIGRGPRHVYVVSGGVRHVKIGIASDVNDRIRGIQTGCPFKVKLVQAWRNPYARKIEKVAHSILGKYRVAGEWFDVPGAAAALVVQSIVDDNPKPSLIKRPAKPENGAVVFCSYCRHSGLVRPVPGPYAMLRCSVCKKADHVHVIELRATNF